MSRFKEGFFHLKKGMDEGKGEWEKREGRRDKRGERERERDMGSYE